MRYSTSACWRVLALLLLGCGLALPAQTADESTSATYRLRSRTRSALVEWRVGRDHGLSGSIGEPFPGLQMGKGLSLAQTDVFEPSTVQVVLWLTKGFNLLSLPFDYAGTVDGLFADEYGPLATGQVLSWDPVAMRYLPLTVGIPAGEGFWLRSQAAARVVVRGTRVSLRARPLQAGWSLLGRTWDGDAPGTVVCWSDGAYVEGQSVEYGVGYWYYLPSD